MLHSMAKLAPKITITLAALMLALSAAPAYADRCFDACGPAPCCTFLWIEICGCPWGEPGDPQEFAQLTAPEESQAGAACTLAPSASSSALLSAAEHEPLPAR